MCAPPFKLTWRAASLERPFPLPHTTKETLARANEGCSGCSKTHLELLHLEPLLKHAYLAGKRLAVMVDQPRMKPEPPAGESTSSTKATRVSSDPDGLRVGPVSRLGRRDKRAAHLGLAAVVRWPPRDREKNSQREPLRVVRPLLLDRGEVGLDKIHGRSNHRKYALIIVRGSRRVEPRAGRLPHGWPEISALRASEMGTCATSIRRATLCVCATLA